MKIRNYIVNLARILLRLGSDSKIHITLIVILIYLILGSSIPVDILLEQLLQADGVTRLSPL